MQHLNQCGTRKNKSTGQARTIYYRLEQAGSIEHLTEPLKAIENLQQSCKST